MALATKRTGASRVPSTAIKDEGHLAIIKQLLSQPLNIDITMATIITKKPTAAAKPFSTAAHKSIRQQDNVQFKRVLLNAREGPHCAVTFALVSRLWSALINKEKR